MLLLFSPVYTDLETLVRFAANKATNTELTQNSEFTQVLSTMLKQSHQTLNVDLKWVVLQSVFKNYSTD